MRKDSLALLRPDHCLACGKPAPWDFGCGPTVTPDGFVTAQAMATRHDPQLPIRVHPNCTDRWLQHLRRTSYLDCSALLDPPEWRRGRLRAA
jgi:hypothetical protein